MRNTGRSWNEVKRIAGDGNTWKPYAPQGVKGLDDNDEYKDVCRTALFNSKTVYNCINLPTSTKVI
jgi:hypothetical protein